MSNELHQSPEVDLRRRKRRGWLIIGACFAGLLGLFGWSLFGPNPPLVVSKQTTYITSPLRPDGTPDYEAYLLSKQNRKLPREENAAVVMWQLQGPGSSYTRVNADNWRLLEQELGSLAPEAGVGRLSLINQPELTDAIKQWLDDQRKISKQPQIWDDVYPDDVIAFGYDKHWSSKEVPPLAEWVKTREAAFQQYLVGAKRPGFYAPSPSYLDDRGESLANQAFAEVGVRRDVARVHGLRGYHAWGENDYASAATHFAATLQWAKHFERSEYLVDALVAIAIQGIGYTAIQNFAADPEISAEDLEVLQQATFATSPRLLGQVFRGGERFFSLDCALQAWESPVFLNEFSMDGKSISTLYSRTRIDINPALELLNEYYDRLNRIAKIKSYPLRRVEIEKLIAETDRFDVAELNWKNIYRFANPPTRNEAFAETLLFFLSTWDTEVFAADDRHEAQREFTLVTLALALHRIKHGAYPEKLADIQPPLPANLKADTFQGKPLGYRRTEEGFLLYSFGPNGVDDGADCHANAPIVSRGVSKKAGIEIDAPNAPTGIGTIKESADDYSLRLPRPVEPWPWEVNAANLKAMEGTEAFEVIEP